MPMPVRAFSSGGPWPHGLFNGINWLQTMMPPTISNSTAENVAVLENQLIHVLDELEARESSGRRLEAEVVTLGKKLAAAKHQVGLLYTDHLEQVARWQEEKGKLQAEANETEQRLAAAQAKVEEFEDHLKKLGGGEDVVKKKMAETARRVALLRANEAILSRRYKVLETQQGEALASLEELHKEAATMEARSVRMDNMVIRHSVFGNLVVEFVILSCHSFSVSAGLTNSLASLNQFLVLSQVFSASGRPGKLVNSSAPKRFSASK